ncbi:MAG: response regulator [Proteobacteria bacterium]|nr:response regulator [Pseudomonadota bacterium]
MNLKVNQPILIVEDSHEDYEATIRAFRKAGLSNPIIRCESGDDALDYLHRRGPYTDQSKFPIPGLILLDLNLPGSDGRDVLKDIKSHDYLKKIPVVVLTTSNDERDIDRCYEDGANSYICKPLNLDNFIKSIQQLTDYWFEIVILPKGE